MPLQQSPPVAFPLPPQAHLLADPNHDPGALAEAAAGGAPFYSSYGLYQPIIAPYPRFLTPSPEPSQLGELDLDLNGFTSEPHPTSPRRDITYDTLWNGFSHPDSHDHSANDPFAGMNLAQSAGPSSPRSTLSAIPNFDPATYGYPLPQQRYQLPPQGVHTFESHQRQLAMEVDGAQSGVSWAPVGEGEDVKGKKRSVDGDDEGSPFSATDTTPVPAAGPKPKKPRASRAKGAQPPTGASASAPGAADGGAGGGGGGGGGGKKNRNPHATQLPGNGTRKQTKPEAGEGHEGPICTHCQAISTPLWRRGPDDELLCNACGLYLKLHNKPRPKGFGKNAPTNRGGAAAVAAASAIPKCKNCEATSTPMWRKDVDGNLCCNACSLYYKLHQVVRPSSLSQKKRQNSANTVHAAATATGTASPMTNGGSQPPSGQPSPGVGGVGSPSTAPGLKASSLPSMAIPSLFELPPTHKSNSPSLANGGAATQSPASATHPALPDSWSAAGGAQWPPSGSHEGHQQPAEFASTQVFAPLLSLAAPSPAVTGVGAGVGASWTRPHEVPGEGSPVDES